MVGMAQGFEGGRRAGRARLRLMLGKGPADRSAGLFVQSGDRKPQPSVAAQILGCAADGGGAARRLGRRGQAGHLVGRSSSSRPGRAAGRKRLPLPGDRAHRLFGGSRASRRPGSCRDRGRSSMAPPEICRARWAANSTRSNRVGVLSTASPTANARHERASWANNEGMKTGNLGRTRQESANSACLATMRGNASAG